MPLKVGGLLLPETSVPWKLATQAVRRQYTFGALHRPLL